MCCDIKNRLLRLSDSDVPEPEDDLKLVELGDLLEDLNKSYKKKRGRKKRSDRHRRNASSSDDEEFPKLLSRGELSLKELPPGLSQRNKPTP